jgi:hypothetical protein
VKSSDIGSNGASASNRFSIRAFSSDDVNGKNSISIAGRERMAIYANAQGAITEFYLARVPSGAAGQTLRVRLFDVGDSAGGSGNIQILKPPDATGSDDFKDCKGAGPSSGTFATCLFSVSSAFDGKWETLSVPIPSNYACTDIDTTKCWVRLKYTYGGAANPHDQTTWTAGIDGDPVRLVE